MDISEVAKEVRSGSRSRSKLTLLPNQKKHFRRIVKEILPYNEGYIDGSDMGRGKTITACAISIYYKLPLFVICPLTITKVWKDAIDAYGLKFIDVMSYEKFAGRKKPSHNYLRKNISDVYEVTDELQEIIDKGALFIFDECQFIKSYHTARFRACHSVTMAISGTASRFGVLSGTPFDKVAFTISIMKLFNIMTEAILYTKRKDTYQIYLLGLQEVIDYASEIDADSTKEIIDEDYYSLTYTSINRKLVENLIYDLYDKIIKNKIGSSIEGLPFSNKIYLHDGFFNVIENRESLIANISSFEDAAKPLLNESSITLNHLERLNKLRSYIELDKVSIFARLAREKLEDKDTRVAIALNGIAAIKKLCAMLHEYDPLVLIGEVRDRGNVIDAFQEVNSTRRLLVLNVSLGQGISLHDLYGNRKTYLYISPSYSIINMTQTIGRFYREGVKSDTYVYIVYTNIEGYREHKIMTALIEKAKAVKGSVPNYEAGFRISLPGEFETYIEY